MANLALDTVYNHYLTTYFHDTVTKYDAHKKDELKGVYNSIVKLNKESPLFLPVKSQETKQFAVGVKESARELKNTIASLRGLGQEELLNKKVAFSTNKSLAEAIYIGDDSESETIPTFEMGVLELAKPQVNLGKFLESDARGLAEDTYSFDVNINNLSYEFQYNVNSDDTNQSIQEKLARLINGANIGLEAQVETDGEFSALKLVSNGTGKPEGRKTLFSVSDDNTSRRAGSASYFGIDEVTQNSSNALFTINGVEREAGSNHFTVEKSYEITLNGVSPDEDTVTSIGVKNDTESLRENITKLMDGYNTFIDSANSVASEETKNQTLLREMKNLSSYYKEGLDEFGLDIDDDGHMVLDKSIYEQAFENENLGLSLGKVKSFANALMRKTDTISINPMQYVNKTVVAYKNPGKNFATPYITSPYSGLLFNSYC